MQCCRCFPSRRGTSLSGGRGKLKLCNFYSAKRIGINCCYIDAAAAADPCSYFAAAPPADAAHAAPAAAAPAAAPTPSSTAHLDALIHEMQDDAAASERTTTMIKEFFSAGSGFEDSDYTNDRKLLRA